MKAQAVNTTFKVSNSARVGLILVFLITVLIVSLRPPLELDLADREVSDYVEFFTPFILVALLIERALEVFLTTWRGPKSAQLELELKQLKTDKAAALAIQQKEDEVLNYKMATQRIAFGASVIIGIIVSLLGMRMLGVVFDADSVAVLLEPQKSLFHITDVMLTGLLLGGGADGIHKVVSLFTTYMDETKKKVKEQP